MHPSHLNHFHSFFLSSSILNLIVIFWVYFTASLHCLQKLTLYPLQCLLCLQDTIFNLIDLSIAVFDAFFAFTALSVIHSNSRIDLEESLVRFVFGVWMAKPTRGSSISCPCSVHWLFQVGLHTNYQGFPPCFFLSCSCAWRLDFFTGCTCQEACLIAPGSLTDQHNPCEPWLKMSEIMVDSKSVLDFNSTPFLLHFKDRECLVFLFFWYTFCLIAFSTMEDLDVLYNLNERCNYLLAQFV